MKHALQDHDSNERENQAILQNRLPLLSVGPHYAVSFHVAFSIGRLAACQQSVT